MSDPFRDQPFPRGALWGIAALLGFTLLAVGFARFTETGADRPLAVAEVAASRDLRFEDRPGGTILVYASETDELVARLEPGTENFIRGVLRGLARERRSQDIGAAIPFRISRYENGRLTLTDLATGRSIDLRAFGATNSHSFSRLLTAPATSS